MFLRFDEILAMTLQGINETKHFINYKGKLDIVFMKHCAPNHAFVDSDDLTR